LSPDFFNLGNWGSRRGWAPPHFFRLPLNGGLQVRRRFEAHGLAGLDLDRLAGARVHALARLGLPDREGAEARQGEPAGFFDLLDDGLDQIRSSAVCGDAGDPG
jgi:hypothetical protein